MEELQARLKALLRRAPAALTTALRLARSVWTSVRQSVALHGKPVELTSYEYRLLAYLVKQRGAVVPKSELADYLYPHDQIATVMCWKY